MPVRKIYDVVVAGELNVDIILDQIHNFPAMKKEVIADQMTITLGSSSAIFASNLSVLGAKVAFSGTLGSDYFGEYIIERLQSKGVDTQHIVRTDRKGTGATVALSFQDDRAMVTYPGAMSLFTIADISEDLLSQSAHLHMSSVFLSTGLKKDVHHLFRRAKSLGLTTSLDPQWDPDEKWDVDFKSLLPDVDVFIPNEQELCAMTGKRDLCEAVEEIRPHANILVVKKGREGASLYKGDEHIDQPAYLNPAVVDTIGAGDSFGAGFIHSFLRGRSLKECLEFGAVAGAVSTTAAGGTTAFKDFNTVKAIAETEFHYKM